jgi:hypothetical protein
MVVDEGAADKGEVRIVEFEVLVGGGVDQRARQRLEGDFR